MQVQGITKSFGRATAFNQDLALWNAAAVLVADDLFLSARNFNSDISNWNVASMVRACVRARRVGSLPVDCVLVSCRLR